MRADPSPPSLRSDIRRPIRPGSANVSVVRIRWHWLLEWNSLVYFVIGAGTLVGLPAIGIVNWIRSGDLVNLWLVVVGPLFYVLLRWRDDV